MIAAAAVWCWWIGWRGSRPYEDAAILFRYVDNVAAGHGIVWNVGDAPVDGATDLGFMLLLAAVKTSGIGAETAALIVNSMAFVCIAGGLFVFARRRVPTLLAMLVTALFILSPGVTLIRAGFGAVFFSGLVALAALAMFRLTDEPTVRSALLLVSAGAGAGLVRPEGFLIAGVLIATAAAIGGRPVLRAAALAGALLLIVGIVFVMARWAFFGYPLPNPYYKKGHGTLHIDGLVDSLEFARTVAVIPIALLILVGVLGHVTRRWIAYIGCISVLLGMWALLSSEMNYNFRFQFPTVTIVLFMIVDLGSRAVPSLSERAGAMPRTIRPLTPFLFAGVVAAHVVATQQRLSPPEPLFPQETIAKVLAQSGHDHLVVATTEAGYVCWKSGWRCIDLWGLNDKRIAHEGYLDERALTDLHPDVIVVHAPTSPTASSIHGARDFLDGWEAMTDPLIRFAESREYTLAAILGPKPTSGIAVYVRAGEDWSNHLVSEFGAIEPTIEHFYGPSTASHPSLPTTE